MSEFGKVWRDFKNHTILGLKYAHKNVCRLQAAWDIILWPYVYRSCTLSLARKVQYLGI